MGDSVKGSREIKENGYTDVSRVCGDEEIVNDFYEGGLCAVVCSESRLKGFVELMVGHMLVELSSNCFFQHFAERPKVGDRSVVV